MPNHKTSGHRPIEITAEVRARWHAQARPVTGVDECWEWVGMKDNNGLPMLYLGTKKTVCAHRVAYLMFVDERLPSSLEVHHRCGNIGCVNPAHMALRCGGRNEYRPMKGVRHGRNT